MLRDSESVLISILYAQKQKLNVEKVYKTEQEILRWISLNWTPGKKNWKKKCGHGIKMKVIWRVSQTGCKHQ